MRGKLLLVWLREEKEDHVIYWQVNLIKWDCFWMAYVLYSVFNIISGAWILRKLGILKQKARVEDWMRKYPRFWATPLVIPKEIDKHFDYEKMMRWKFKRRDWESFPAWMGFGIGPFTIG